MLTGRRAAVALAVLGVALSGLLWQPGPEEAAADHESAPAGQYWTPAPGDVQSTYEFRHVNVWTQACDGVRCPHGDTETSYTQCRLRAASPETVRSDGCGHTRPSWTWDDHGCIPNTNPQQCNGDNLGNAVHTCTAGGTTRTVSDPAHCGTWTTCTTGIPNTDRSGCVPCPAGLQPTADGECELAPCPDGDDHRHATAGGGAHTICAASLDPPECIEGLPPERTGTWQGPGHRGDPGDGHADVPGIAGCPVEQDEPECDTAGQHTHSGAGSHTCRIAHAAPRCPATRDGGAAISGSDDYRLLAHRAGESRTMPSSVTS